MGRADHEPERVRNHQADEADEAGKSDRRARQERGRAEHRGRGAIRIDTESRGGLLAESVRVDAMRENDCEPEPQSHNKCGDTELGPADHRDAALQPPQHGSEL